MLHNNEFVVGELRTTRGHIRTLIGALLFETHTVTHSYQVESKNSFDRFSGLFYVEFLEMFDKTCHQNTMKSMKAMSPFRFQVILIAVDCNSNIQEKRNS